MVGFPQRRRTSVVVGGRPPVPTHVQGAFAKGRVYALFGGRGVGKSTLCRIVREASEHEVVVFTGGGDADTDAIARARKDGCEAVLLDGMPASVDEVQWLYDERLVAPVFGGAVIRVDRNAVVDRGFAERLGAVEARILDLSMPYFTVRNDDLERCVVDLLRRIGVTR